METDRYKWAQEIAQQAWSVPEERFEYQDQLLRQQFVAGRAHRFFGDYVKQKETAWRNFRIILDNHVKPEENDSKENLDSFFQAMWDLKSHGQVMVAARDLFDMEQEKSWEILSKAWKQARQAHLDKKLVGCPCEACLDLNFPRHPPGYSLKAVFKAILQNLRREDHSWSSAFNYLGKLKANKKGRLIVNINCEVFEWATHTVKKIWDQPGAKTLTLNQELLSVLVDAKLREEFGVHQTVADRELEQAKIEKDRTASLDQDNSRAHFLEFFGVQNRHLKAVRTKQLLDAQENLYRQALERALREAWLEAKLEHFRLAPEGCLCETCLWRLEGNQFPPAWSSYKAWATAYVKHTGLGAGR